LHKESNLSLNFLNRKKSEDSAVIDLLQKEQTDKKEDEKPKEETKAPGLDIQ